MVLHGAPNDLQSFGSFGCYKMLLDVYTSFWLKFLGPWQGCSEGSWASKAYRRSLVQDLAEENYQVQCCRRDARPVP